MLVAGERWPISSPPPKRRRRGGGSGTLILSGLLHAIAVAALLLSRERAMPQPQPLLEVELVQQSALTRGAPTPPTDAPAPAPAPETPAAPAPPPKPPAPPLSPTPQAPAPSTAALPSTPPPAARRQTPQERSAPEVNLGNAAQDLDPWNVTGENVVPPAPDAQYRNLPPHYPAEAARIGAEGTVQLVARISPSGLPLSVGVVQSSGNADLDEEARRAVLLWRFRPAREGGKSVPYDYLVNIRFALGDR